MQNDQRDDAHSRREFLRAGAIGSAGVLLGGGAFAGTRPRPGPPANRKVVNGSRKAADQLVVVWLDGGPSARETWDPRPDAPAIERGPFGSIATAVPGVRICEHLPRCAAILDKMIVFRAIKAETGDHFDAAHRMLTGFAGGGAVDPTPREPSLAAILAADLGSLGRAPALVQLGDAHTVGLRGGYFGDGSPGTASEPAHLGATLPGADWAARLDPARRARDLDAESSALRDRYGRNAWGELALTARQQVEQGARCVALTLGGWDWHANLAEGMAPMLSTLDAAVATLVEDLDARGLLDSTMVVVKGEFGRSARMNPSGGRDHHPDDFLSVLAAGGTLPGGLIEDDEEHFFTATDLVGSIAGRFGLEMRFPDGCTLACYDSDCD